MVLPAGSIKKSSGRRYLGEDAQMDQGTQGKRLNQEPDFQLEDPFNIGVEMRSPLFSFLGRQDYS